MGGRLPVRTSLTQLLALTLVLRVTLTRRVPSDDFGETIRLWSNSHYSFCNMGRRLICGPPRCKAALVAPEGEYAGQSCRGGSYWAVFAPTRAQGGSEMQTFGAHFPDYSHHGVLNGSSPPPRPLGFRYFFSLRAELSRRHVENACRCHARRPDNFVRQSFWSEMVRWRLWGQ